MEKNDKKKSGRSDRFWLFVQIAAGLVAPGRAGRDGMDLVGIPAERPGF